MRLLTSRVRRGAVPAGWRISANSEAFYHVHYHASTSFWVVKSRFAIDTF